jgi:predicted RNA binding protein YcfA (HicA-like mRNA interferase family)
MPGKRADRLPGDLPTSKVLRALQRLGFVVDHEGGKHTVLKDPTDASRVAVVPRHSRLKADLLRAILRGAGISEADFLARY